jgi:DNA helicase-2/ATP-dependent DNA helicase PcrA
MTDKLLKDINESQCQAVTFGEGPVLILAGAGSGKTRALTYRAAYLLKEKKAKPEEILLVTFTNKAAGEMKERVKKLVGKKSQLPWAGTFHSFCAKLLRIEGQEIGVAGNYVIYDEDDSLEIVKQAMMNLKVDRKLYKPMGMKALISQAKNELIGALEYGQLARGHWQATMSQVYIEYQRLLKQYEALDFDDLLMETVRLLRKSQEVLSKCQNKFRYVLVDEYQDTNKAQYELTKMLAGRWRNLCCVGDFSQSIYSWRGADFRNLKRLEVDWPDLKVINLEQNYRSTQSILEAANQVIVRNSSHPVLKLWTKAGLGERLRVVEAETEKEEAEFIVGKIKKSKRYGDWAVLYRTNAQSRVIEEAFIRSGIPYVLVGGVKFYSRREVKDCLAYLRYLNNPKDVVSYKRLEKLGKRRLEKFLDWGEKNKSKLKKMTTKEILGGTLKVSGYLERFDKKDEQDLMRLENIKELKSVAEEFPGLREFLENVALVEQTDILPEKPKSGAKKRQAVTLMTLHASKGLEFKKVFMIGMEEGLFPHSRSMMDRNELEEERRLCYVGMTRAMKEVFFSYARRRLYFGRHASNAVSRFLGDIEEELLEVVEASHDMMKL